MKNTRPVRITLDIVASLRSFFSRLRLENIEDFGGLLADAASHQRVGNEIGGYRGSGRSSNSLDLFEIEMRLREVLGADEAITGDPSIADDADKPANSKEK